MGQYTYITKLRIFFFLLLVVFLLTVVGFVFLVMNEVPAIDKLRDYRPSVSTKVYSDSGEIIDEFFLEDRKFIAFSEIPQTLKDAFVASEDASFYEHSGFDFAAIARAFLKNLIAGRVVQGGSTITQQVAKTLYLTPERSVLRKTREVILAFRIDKYLSKDEILNLYLNQIYLGHGAYGVEAASLIYFGKGVKHLTLAETALLAGLPKAPSLYSPRNNMERAKQRQHYVLDRMLIAGKISEKEKEEALKEPIILMSVRSKDKLAPYFIENVRRYIAENYGYYTLYREGLEIYTTLNTEMQRAANAAVTNGIRSLEESGHEEYKNNTVQAALLCMDARTGEIKAMVGGRDFSNSEFNRATQAQRQPGSIFKPFVYSAAFDKGYNPSMLLNDEPVSYFDPTSPEGNWTPKNYDEQFWGMTTLRQGLIHSRNIVTVKLLDLVGPRYLVNYARNLGIESPLLPTLSLALGSYSMNLQELVRAYGVFANSGKRVKPFFIRRILDRKGTVFEENEHEIEQVMDPKIAYMTTYILEEAIRSGTGKRVRPLGRSAGGKTGTTNDLRDAWFIGYTPRLVTGVWVGFDNNAPLHDGAVGGVVAAPIWLSFMSAALRGAPLESFSVPNGVIFQDVMYRAINGSDSKTVREIFLEGSGDILDVISVGKAAEPE
ncbi:MAG: penicillin-binding protein 1A [Deltaproteobacteria bacterium]|nr:penicillin-binding protein 1A [Deltaproteobacteria bacterium]